MSSWVGKLQAFAGTVVPWYLRRKNIGRFLESNGLFYDSALESLGQGLRLSQPLRCDSSALAYLSADRSIRLYPTEPDASKRYRLSIWWQLHRGRGTARGEMEHSRPYFDTPPLMRIVHQDGAGASATWHTLHPDGTYAVHRATPSNWNYGPSSDTGKWSRFWIIVYAPADFLNMSFYDDGGEYDDGEAYDGILDTQVALDLISMVTDWKSAHSKLKAYIITTEPTSFDPSATAVTSPDGWTSLPNGNWYQVLDSGGVRQRPPYAHWIYER